MGSIPWNKGIKTGPRSEEIKAKFKDRIPWNKGKKGVQVPWNKGIKMGPQSPEHRAKLSAKGIERKKLRKPWSYHGVEQGIPFDSSFEQKFIAWVIKCGWEVERCKDRIPYRFNKGYFTYNPDLRCWKDGVEYIVETKGWESLKDLAKKAAGEEKYGDKYLYLNTDTLLQMRVLQ